MRQPRRTTCETCGVALTNSDRNTGHRQCRKCRSENPQTKALNICKECGKPILSSSCDRSIARHRACWVKYKAEVRLGLREPETKARACSVCGGATRRGDGVCVNCRDEEGHFLRLKFDPAKPDSCPLCYGLPWRRGNELPGSVCRKCGLPYAAEPQPTIDEFMGRRDAA